MIVPGAMNLGSAAKVQGSEYNPLVSTALPKFVKVRNIPSIRAIKMYRVGFEDKQ